MPGCMKSSNRRWAFYHIAGMPSVICEAGNNLSAEKAAGKIMEEWPGQRAAILKDMTAEYPHTNRRGKVIKGRRFLLVCTD
jgi:hypothetical protein